MFFWHKSHENDTELLKYLWHLRNEMFDLNWSDAPHVITGGRKLFLFFLI